MDIQAIGQRCVGVELAREGVGAGSEAGIVFGSPPVDLVALHVELAACVVEAVGGLVNDGGADAAVLIASSPSA